VDADKDLAKLLCERLQEKTVSWRKNGSTINVRCFWDNQNLFSGCQWKDVFLDGLHHSCLFLPLVSEAAVDRMRKNPAKSYAEDKAARARKNPAPVPAAVASSSGTGSMSSSTVASEDVPAAKKSKKSAKKVPQHVSTFAASNSCMCFFCCRARDPEAKQADDNVLLEYETATRLLKDVEKLFILPVLIGKRNGEAVSV
jgi:hypothetical protein